MQLAEIVTRAKCKITGYDILISNLYFDTTMNNMPGLYLEILSIYSRSNTH